MSLTISANAGIFGCVRIKKNTKKWYNKKDPIWGCIWFRQQSRNTNSE